MKKRYLLGMLLAILSTLFLFAACSGDQTPDETQASTEAPTVETLSLLAEDGTFRYTVVRPADADKELIAAAVKVRTALQDAYGTKITISDDILGHNVDEAQASALYEILIGDTDRKETREVQSVLGNAPYRITVIGNKILIVGKDSNAAVKAIDQFLETYGDGTPIPTDLSVTADYNKQVFDTILNDTSTGNVTPRIVTTKYPTEDIVAAEIIATEDGYAVSGDGHGDSTDGIQKALNDCAANGGGTVYLPAGTYNITRQITIPPFVTLRGDWQDPDEGTEYGTVICIWDQDSAEYAAGNEVTEGTFMLGGSGGAVGLTVYYPEQDIENIKPYPFTFYTNGVGANYMLSTVKNVTVINGYRGIGACCKTGGGAHEQLTVENFKGTFLYCGAEVYNQADVGTWQQVTIDPKYWSEAKGDGIKAADTAALQAYSLENAVGLKLGDLEWTEFEALTVRGCSIGIEIMPGKRIQFAGSFCDSQVLGCTRGMVIHELDRRWGMVIANSTFENGIYNNSYEYNTDGIPGTVKLCNVKTTGELTGEIVEYDAPEIASCTVDYRRSYQKPNAVLYTADLAKDAAQDVTAALQSVIDSAAQTGGVVYLPAGTYRLDGAVTVPAGVELRGASSTATRDQGGKSLGTVLLCYYADDSAADAGAQAFITLAGENAGINGIRIVYPENGPKDNDLYTSYTVRGTASGVYIVNSMISASAYGVDFSGCDDHFIKKVSACCYYNTFLVGGKNGMIAGCLQNGTVLCRTGLSELMVDPLAEADIFNGLFNPITRRENKFIIVRGADGQQIYNTFVYGCANMIVCEDSSVLAVNIGSDNIGSRTAQLVMHSGDMTVINAMRYNGVSYEHSSGTLRLYNRLTIENKKEQTYIEQK